MQSRGSGPGPSPREQSMPVAGLCESLHLPELSPLSCHPSDSPDYLPPQGLCTSCTFHPVHATHLPWLTVPCHHSALSLVKCKFQSSPHFYVILFILSQLPSPSVIINLLVYCLLMSLPFLTLNFMRTGDYICVIPHYVLSVWESLAPGKCPRNSVT